MRDYLKDTLIGLYVLMIAFSYSIFFIIQAGFGLQANGSGLKIFSGIIAIVSVCLFLFDGKNINPVVKRKSVIVCIIITALFYFTRVLYGYLDKNYESYFLSMGVNFIPAILTGTWMVQYNDIATKLERGLIPFIILYTFILANIVFNARIGVNMNETFSQTVLSYQSISYYSAYALGFTLYVMTCDNYPILIRRIIIGFGLIQLLMAIMGGGRGAFILCIVFLLYFGSKQMSWKNLLFIAVIIFIGFNIVSSFLNNNQVFQLGFNRIFNFFNSTEAMTHDLRWVRWHRALDAFYLSPIIGHGIGGVFYEVGFYSHNIFTDLLCEGGIILTIIFAIVLIVFLKDIVQLIQKDSKYEILMLIFLCSFVMCLFSGYYLAEGGMWLAVSYILGKSYILKYEEYDEEYV